MNSAALVCLSLVVAPVVGPSGDDLKTIQGEWQVVATAWQGEPNDCLARAVVEKNLLSIHTATGVGRFEIKRIKNGEIDLIKKSPPGTDLLHLGIYEMRGDSLLKICYTTHGTRPNNEPAKRPSDYRSPKDSLNFVYFLQRKTEKK